MNCNYCGELLTKEEYSNVCCLSNLTTLKELSNELKGIQKLYKSTGILYITHNNLKIKFNGFYGKDFIEYKTGKELLTNELVKLEREEVALKEYNSNFTTKAKVLKYRNKSLFFEKLTEVYTCFAHKFEGFDELASASHYLTKYYKEISEANLLLITKEDTVNNFEVLNKAGLLEYEDLLVVQNIAPKIFLKKLIIANRDFYRDEFKELLKLKQNTLDPKNKKVLKRLEEGDEDAIKLAGEDLVILLENRDFFEELRKDLK
jgi:hypothetical protein